MAKNERFEELQVRIGLRLGRKERDLWESVARKNFLKLSEFIRTACDMAAAYPEILKEFKAYRALPYTLKTNK